MNIMMRPRQDLIRPTPFCNLMCFAVMVMFLFATKLFAQDSIVQWERTYGGSDDDGVSSIIKTEDGGTIMCGYTASSDGDITYNHGGYDLWVVKLKTSGDLEWEKTYGGSNSEFGSQILNTSDSGYIIVGASSSSDGDIKDNKGANDVLIIKINNKGILQWEKTYGGSGYDDGISIINSPDSGYVVAAMTSSTDSDITYNHGQYDVWILKVDKNGKLLWQKTYGSSGFDRPNSIAYSPEDSGYVIAAEPGDSDGDVTKLYGNEDAWIFKISKTGKLLWQKTYGTQDYDYASSIIRTQDSGYILTGATGASKMGDFFDYWAFKIKKDTTVVWDNRYGGRWHDESSASLSTSDNGCIATGYTKSHDGDIRGYYDQAGQAMWTIKLSDIGALQWQRVDGGITDDYKGQAIAIASDGGYVLAGSTTLNSYDIVVIKLAGHWKPKILDNSDCLPHKVRLTTSDPIFASDSLSVFWDFGDGKGYVSGGDTVFTPLYSKAGTYKIYLYIENNRSAYSGNFLSEDSITINVTGKTLSTPSVLLKGNDTLIASYTGDSCQWYLDSVMVSNGKCEYIATKSGKYQVMVYDSSCPSPLSAVYNFTFVGIEGQSKDEVISIYPNPANSKLYIRVADELSPPLKGVWGMTPARATITDLSGRTLLMQSIIADETVIDVSTLPSGIYLLRYQDNERVQVLKFSKN